MVLPTIALLTTLLAAGVPDPPTLASDDAAVREVVRQYVDARERRNPAAIGRLFTADADQLTSSGEWRRGRDGVVQGALASSARTGGTRSIVVERVRLAGSDVAIADGRYEISGLADGGTRTMWTTFILRKQTDGWRIAAIRNMLPAALPRATPRKQ